MPRAKAGKKERSAEKQTSNVKNQYNIGLFNINNSIINVNQPIFKQEGQTMTSGLLSSQSWSSISITVQHLPKLVEFIISTSLLLQPMQPKISEPTKQITPSIQTEIVQLVDTFKDTNLDDVS